MFIGVEHGTLSGVLYERALLHAYISVIPYHVNHRIVIKKN